METLIASDQKQAPTEIKKSSSLAFTLSLVVFLIVFLGTIGIKVYVYALEKKLENIQTRITDIETTIKETKSRNPEVNAYSLWEKAKGTINAQIQKSQAQIYLTQLDTIARAFYRKISFTGFSFSEGKVVTHAAAFGSTTDGALNIIELLRNYRGEPKTKDPLFLMNPILSITGDSTRREFDITFTTKAPTITTTSGTVAPATPTSSTSTTATSTGTTSTGSLK